MPARNDEWLPAPSSNCHVSETERLGFKAKLWYFGNRRDPMSYCEVKGYESEWQRLSCWFV